MNLNRKEEFYQRQQQGKMMVNFKIAGVSAAVSMILASAASHAAPEAIQTAPIKSVKSQSAASGSYDAAVQQALAAKPTKTGLKSHFDAQLGKATFLWAPKSMAAPDFTGILPEQRAAHASDFYLNALLGSSALKGASQVKLANLHDEGKGTRIAKYKQEIMGVEVFNREFNIMLDEEFSLVAASGFLARNQLPAGQLAPAMDFGSAEVALRAAISELTEGQLNAELQLSKEQGKYSVFTAKGETEALSLGKEARAKKVYFDGKKGLIPSYYVEVEMTEEDGVSTELFSYVISGQDGSVLSKHSLTVDDSVFHYRAYAREDKVPMQGPHGKVVPQLEPGNDPTEILEAPLVSISSMPSLSTQDPWLPEDAEFTLGNNAFAYADIVAPGGYSDGDFTAELTSAKTFDYPLSDEVRSNNIKNRKAAIVNLFYMTNYLHDYYYDYGFDEASGNAQISNYGRGGLENDPLLLEAQDFSGKNNANMSTPADGGAPRMQQYLWTDKDATVGEDWGTVVTNVDGLDLLPTSQVASFGAQQYDVTASLARIDDGTDTTTDGCEMATNAAELAGKIAVVDRGGCAFTVKALNAQDAGAVGVLVVNNTDDGTPAPMGGTDSFVRIPAQGLSFADGASLYAEIDADVDVEVNMFSSYPLKDSTFDNAIIAHEFGHYMQNRLIGNASGLTNFQGRSMGEGWSDVHALLFVTDEADLQLEGNEEFGLGYGVGTFVADFFYGIRRAPYTTDMEVNPYTFAHIETGAGPVGFPATSNASPHGAGEIWAVALWEFYVALINEHGFAEAKDRMSRYVVEGYKMTPVTPTYTEARDAIFAAASANDDLEIAITAFAKRGMGLGAISPNRFDNNHTGVVESFETELASYNAVSVNFNPDFDGAEVGFCTADGVLDIGETGTISVTVSNVGNEVLENVKAVISVVGDADVTIENDGEIVFETLNPFTRETSAELKVTVNDAAVADDIEFVVTFPEAVENDAIVEAEDITLNATLNYDFEKVAPVNFVSMDDMEDESTFADLTVNIMDGGDNAKGLAYFDTVNTPFFNSLVAADLGSQVLRMSDFAGITDVAYETAEFEIGYAGSFQVSFWHAYWMEADWDGGVVEISVNGSAWKDVTEFGGYFMVNGYNNYLDEDVQDQPLAGRMVFSGQDFAPASANGGIEVIDFGEALNGNMAKLRFRIATDSAVNYYGWWIDNLTLSNVASPVHSEVVSGVTGSCDNTAPQILAATEAVTVNEGEAVTLSVEVQDRNAVNAFTYEWVQTSGAEVSMSGADSATMTFTAPQVSATNNFTFEVTVSDGVDSVKSTSVVTVANVPKPVVPAPTDDESGSFGWLALLLTPFALLRRRMKR